MQYKTAYTFDDINLEPRLGVLDSRSFAKTETQITPKIRLNIPLISMSMPTVTGEAMAIEMAKYGGLGMLHRHNTIEEQVEMLRQVKEYQIDLKKYKKAVLDSEGRLLVAGAIGMKDDSYLTRAEKLLENGADLIVMDIPHAHMVKTIRCLEKLKRSLETEVLIGNVVTYEGFKDLAEAGADAIKIGIGNGTICKTRIMTGFGVPQLTALENCYKAVKETGAYMIAEGGTRNPGDLVKCLAFGASAIIIGSQFAGTDESPATIIQHEGKDHKLYYGLASRLAKEKELGQRLDDLTEEELDNVAGDEGVPSLVPCTGPVRKKIRELVKGIQGAISFSGTKTVKEIIGAVPNGKMNVHITTSAGQRESSPHTVLTLSDESIQKIAEAERV